MIKKTFILSLILLFSFSSMSLPITISYCSMNMDSGHHSCKMKTNDDGSYKYECHEPEQNYQNQIITERENCCLTKTIKVSLSDIVYNLKTEISYFSFSAVISHAIDLSHLYNFEKTSKISYSDIAPPEFTENDLYLSNSIFLI